MQSNIQDSSKHPPKPLKTKERILETARILFNQHGTGEISTRQIATELGMSHGNLCYHFPRKEDIIEALYKQLVEAMSAQVSALQVSTIETTLSTIPKRKPAKTQSALPPLSLATIIAGATQSFAVLYRYKFLMLDFVSVMRKLPAVQAHYADLVRLRKQQFSGIRAYCVRQGWMRHDLAERFDAQLNEAMFIVGDFWMASAEILYEGEESEKIQHYSHVFSALLVPLLTEQGLREMASVTHEAE